MCLKYIHSPIQLTHIQQNQQMEVALTQSQSLSCTKLPLFQSSASIRVNHSVTFLGFKCSSRDLECLKIKGRQQRKSGAIHASLTESTSIDDGERWLLQPVGDGDSRHIGFKVPLPEAFEITSSVVTVGRVPEKADMVIPVATVSALHARIQMKEGSLVVTDLDSTNGTFIDDKRLSPGVPATISPGRYLTFGDTNLAIFRVSKVQNSEVAEKNAESEARSEIEAATNKSESAI